MVRQTEVRVGPTVARAGSPGPRSLLQRKCACGGTPGVDGECAACRAKRLQREATGHSPAAVPPIVHEVLSSPGQPLDPATRAVMEPRFGHDFSRVRVHADARAAASARAVDALAYTVGHDVVFAQGQHAPGTDSGRTLLAHELVHVVQQSAAGPAMPTGIDPDPALEREAQALVLCARSSRGVETTDDRPQTTATASALPSSVVGRRSSQLPATFQSAGLGESGGEQATTGGPMMAQRRSLQRQPARGATARPNQRLEYRPSIAPPCACLVFVHNEERNARMAVEALHDQCHYNLATIGAGTTRAVPIRGSSGTIDPNELFPSSIQEECTRDQPACEAYEATHDDLRAMQIQFFLTIKRCSRDFTIPTVALHNNAVSDTSTFLRRTTSAGRQSLRGDFIRDSSDPVTSRAELRTRLGPRRGIMDRSGTTNIFRWCNLPEISRCHIGNPDRPDHVIWVTTRGDFDTLSAAGANVVLQEGAETASGTESESDLSTLFVRLGPGARYINIETPGSPQTAAAQSSNLLAIEAALAALGLDCCEPVGDFPLPATDERFA